MRKAGLKLPSKEYLRIINEQPRALTSLIFQLRTGHIPLNKYLYRIQKAESPTCPACEAPEESVHHYIKECPKYRYERRKLEAKADGEDTMAFALSTKEGIKAIGEYIRGTGRFSLRKEA
jgi:hypothetical protein